MATTGIILSIICAQCGKPAQRYYRGSGVRPTVCGNACTVVAWRQRYPDRNAASRRKEKGDQPRLCSCGEILSHGRRMCDECRDARKGARRSAIRLSAQSPKTCRSCGQAVARGRQRCAPCRAQAAAASKEAFRNSEACRVMRRSAKARRRAVERGIEAERFDPLEILSRDGWLCHICGCSTPRRLRGTYNDRAPELDHIIPLAAGGKHTRMNTACACRRCNIAKSDKPLGQMLLIAA